MKARLEVSNGIGYPTMTYLADVRSINKEARAYPSDEGIKSISEDAFIVGFPLTKMSGNIFVKINQSIVSTRLFIDEKEWSRSFL